MPLGLFVFNCATIWVMFCQVCQRILFFVLLLLLSACVRSIPQTHETTPLSPLEVSFTEIPLSGTGVAKTAILHQTLAPLSTPNFVGASVIEVGYYENLLLIVIQIPAGAAGIFEAEANGEPYRCMPQDIFPDRLYCYGRAPLNVEKAHFVLHSPDGKRVLFEADIVVPAVSSHTAQPPG